MKKITILFVICVIYCLMLLFNPLEIPETTSETTPETTIEPTPVDPTGWLWNGQLLASGNCVDEALRILLLLERKASLENIFVAVNHNHAQVVKKTDDSLKFLCVLAGDVFVSDSEFSGNSEITFYTCD